jgi:hypothetical protein
MVEEPFRVACLMPGLSGVAQKQIAGSILLSRKDIRTRVTIFELLQDITVCPLFPASEQPLRKTNETFPTSTQSRQPTESLRMKGTNIGLMKSVSD